MTITVIPAYGRDYKSKKEVIIDWINGKDFQIADISRVNNGAYCSIRDFGSGDKITIRYKQLREILIYNMAK